MGGEGIWAPRLTTPFHAQRPLAIRIRTSEAAGGTLVTWLTSSGNRRTTTKTPATCSRPPDTTEPGGVCRGRSLGIAQPRSGTVPPDYLSRAADASAACAAASRATGTRNGEQET
jgi:hypothetical protein